MKVKKYLNYIEIEYRSHNMIHNGAGIHEIFQFCLFFFFFLFYLNFHDSCLKVIIAVELLGIK